MRREAPDLEDDAFEEALSRASSQAQIVLSGVGVRGLQLAALLDALPVDETGRRRAELIHIGHATLVDRCDLSGLVVAGPARFDGTMFEEELTCKGVRFEQTVSFLQATLGEASFDDATFLGDAYFLYTTFYGNAAFRGTRFNGDVHFSSTSFKISATFPRARFDGSVSFGATTVSRTLSMSDASFRRARQLGPMRVGEGLSLDRASFDEPVRIEVSSRSVSCQETRFRAGMDLRARWAEILADGADFAGPSLMTDLPPDRSSHEGSFIGNERPVDHGRWESCAEPPTDYAPRVVSLRGAKVAELTLACVDLRACSFAAAHGLDRMRIERGRLAQPPPTRLRLRHPFWTRRQTVAEEHHWRAHSYGVAWRSPEVTSSAVRGRQVDEPQPAQIAGIYRSLRKGREDGKDEPGAADFYYGEMEMRRHRDDAPRLDRLTLTAYWLVSGYGMRAGRALTTLLLVIALLALPLDLGGFIGDRSYGGAVLYAVESSVSLLHVPEAQLTPGGQVVTISLRILGPLLFGLAALALRSRVKR